MKANRSRLTGGIVAFLSFVVLLVFGYPLADEALQRREDDLALAQLEEEFRLMETRSSRLAKIEETLKRKKSELMEACITGNRIPDLRDEIIGLVRLSDARLRGLDTHDGQTRPWATDNDDPRSRRLPDFGMESDFELQTHTLNLTADGSLASVKQIIARIEQHHWLMTIDSLEVKPTQANGSTASLDLRLTFYGLDAVPQEVEETVASEQLKIY